jgi:hypothetical protein
MNLITCVAALSVFVSVQVSATGQAPDAIYVDGTAYPLYSDAFAGSNVNDSLLQGPYTGITCSSNWRGYTATWSIEKEQLFLLKVQAGTCGSPKTDIALDSLFPGVTSPIPASWYSGQLLALLSDRESFYNPSKQQDARFLVFTISKGRVLARHESQMAPK